MASSSANKRFFTVSELGLTAASATTGAWTLALSAAGVPAGVVSLDKAAAATNSVIHIPVPKDLKESKQEDGQVASFALVYNVTTADLTTAPSCVLKKFSYSTATGLTATATQTTTIAFTGIDTVGKVSGAAAAGSHIATVSITTPFSLADNESLVATFTMGEAATSVLDITGLQVTYN